MKQSKISGIENLLQDRPQGILLNTNFNKYCKNFNTTTLENEQQDLTFTNNKKIKNNRLVDLTKAKLMYESAEFKSILNESQELKHLSLKCLKTDNEKLSFFIN